MMVVLLILSIVLAAMAPIMTTRIKRDTAGGLNANSIWQWSQNNNGIAAYFGAEANQTAMIGQTEVVSEDQPARLIINTSDTRLNHILFKKDDDVLGKLTFQNESLVLGTGSVEGPYNTAIGVGALSSNTTGADNTANGYQALYTNKTGSDNTANGYQALYTNELGYYNTASGYQALYSNIYGYYNTASGYQALYNNTYGYHNTASGGGALFSNTTGDGNTASGYQALYSNTEGSTNTASGYQALHSNTTGSNNIASGYQALHKNITGNYNTASGYQALHSNTTGDGNTASGYKALYSNTEGSTNTASGYQALYSNTEGIANTANGFHALIHTTGNYNTASGYKALLYNTTGEHNTAIGGKALQENYTGSLNTAIGFGACQNVQGSNKTCIGANSGPESYHDWAESTDDTERIFIGSKSKFNAAPAVLEVHNSDTERFVATTSKVKDTAVVINGNLIVKGGIFAPVHILGSNDHYATLDSRVGLINANVSGDDHWRLSGGKLPTRDDSMPKYYETYGSFKSVNNMKDMAGYISSDRRLKYVGKEFTSGLDKIRQLKVFNYTFKKDEKKTPRVGVIAQDLQKIFPNAVKKGVDGFLTIRMEDMFYALVNAVKELDAKVTAMASDFAKQKEQIKTLTKENKELKAQNKRLEARLNAIEAKLK